MPDLRDAATLVTGASAGIGRETARALASAGANVALVARREAQLEALADDLEAEYGVETLVATADVSEHEAVASVVERTVDGFGGLDVVVCNAGIGGPGPVEEVSVEEYRRLMGVNVDGMFFSARAALPHLRESEGNLIFLGSFAGQYPRPDSSLYAASKWWTRGFAKSLAASVGDAGVAVTVVNPSEVRTDIGLGDADAMKDRYEPGETTEPESIAEAIAFAAAQSPPDAVTELDLYRRDKFSHF